MTLDTTVGKNYAEMHNYTWDESNEMWPAYPWKNSLKNLSEEKNYEGKSQSKTSQGLASSKIAMFQIQREETRAHQSECMLSDRMRRARSS